MGKKKTIMLLITYQCNLRCSYCYEPKLQHFRMDASRAKRIIMEQIAMVDDTYESIEIQFMGGEPLMEFPLIKEVSEWLWSQHFDKKLLVLFAPTNGTLLNEEMKAWFTANRSRIQLGLSLDGNMAMQNLNRSASYATIDVDYFVQTWPNQSVKMTISPDTVGRLSEGVIHLHEKGFRYISADLAMGERVKWNKEALMAYKEELGKLSTYYISRPELIPFSMLNVNISSILHPQQEVKTCSCGEDMVCIDWTGKSYACHLFSPIALPIEKANRSNELYNFSDHSQFSSAICKKCVLNTVCTHCYGMNYLCTDTIATPSPFHCRAFKIQFAANCRFRLAQAKEKGDEKGYNEMINVINRLS